MSEKTKRKEWVKTVAIIFLSVLLVLTFFSNTIKNYSLPEVAAQYTNSGTITNKVRGQGTVESADPYKVSYTKSRKIESVAVHVGDEVEKGDVLYYLEASESTELQEAETAYEKAKLEYEKALITSKVSSSVANAVQSGATTSVADKQAKIDTLLKRIDTYDKKLDEVNAQIVKWETSADFEEKKNLQSAKDTLNAWTEQKKLDDAEIQKATIDKGNAEAAYTTFISSPGDVTGNDYSNKKSELEKAKTDAQERETYWTSASQNATYQITYAEYSVQVAQDAVDKKTQELNNLKTTYSTEKEKAQAELDEYVSDVSSEFSLSEGYEELQAKKKALDKLKAEEGNNTITSPIAGTIISLTYSAGDTTLAGIEEGVCKIQRAGMAYTLSMTLTQEQAKLISVGDEAEIINSWWYSDVHARVKSIKPDPSNPASSKIAVFDLEGDVTSGQQLSLTVGKRSASYDNIVPNSAIREDNNGKFVLRVSSKSTPLGTRYIAERVNVNVLASDETQSAVSGDLLGWDYIITTSSKPIEDGTEVRLKD